MLAGETIETALLNCVGVTGPGKYGPAPGVPGGGRTGDTVRIWGGLVVGGGGGGGGGDGARLGWDAGIEEDDFVRRSLGLAIGVPVPCVALLAT